MSLDFNPNESADPSRPLCNDLIPIILQMLFTKITKQQSHEMFKIWQCKQYRLQNNKLSFYKISVENQHLCDGTNITPLDEFDNLFGAGPFVWGAVCAKNNLLKNLILMILLQF